MESVAILSHAFLNVKGGRIETCRTAMIDLGIEQVDPGLVPNGAKCGDNKMCVDQKCISVDKFQTAEKTCINNCNGNGWCNNFGNCYCKDGFEPPFCEKLKYRNSGNTTNLNSKKQLPQQLLKS